MEYSNEKIAISISEVSEDFGRTHTKPYLFFRNESNKAASKNRIYSLLLDAINDPFDDCVVLQVDKRAILVKYKTNGYVDHPDYIVDIVNVVHKELFPEGVDLQSRMGELRRECDFNWLKSIAQKAGYVITKIFSKLENSSDVPEAPEYKSSKQEEQEVKNFVVERPEGLDLPVSSEQEPLLVEVTHVSADEQEKSYFYKIAEDTEVVEELQEQKEEGLRKILSESDI